MKKQQQELWLKVARFPLDDPQSDYPFSAKLAHNQGWSEEKTLQVIAEYKKFMFLCMTAPNGASPSETVDECWHLHLTFTANYAAFCTETCGKFIHHNPSKGGVTERHRHIDWYEETMKNYVETFQQIPPDNIWTLPKGFKATDYLQKSSVLYPLSIEPFLTPKSPHLRGTFMGYLLWASAILGVFALLTIFGNPFGFVGRDFAIGYFMLAILLIIFNVSYNELNEKHIETNINTLYHSNLNAYQTAFFVGGDNRLVQTIVLELIEKGILIKTPEDEKSKVLTLVMPADFDDSLSHNPLYLTLQTIEKQTVTIGFLNICLFSIKQLYQTEFNALNIDNFPKTTQHIVFFSFLSLGICRCFQGVANHKPIGFLIGIMVIYSLIYVIHQLNNAHLKRLISKIFRLKNADTSSVTLLNRYALEGRDALATASMTDIALALAIVATDWGLPNPRLGKEGSNSFVCGGAVAADSGGGDGGDGGGCSGGDGGGCGGCGGCGGD